MQVRNTDNLEVETDQKQITLFDTGPWWQHGYETHAFCPNFPVLGNGTKKMWSYHENREVGLSQNRWYETARQHDVTPQTIALSTIAHWVILKNSNPNS